MNRRDALKFGLAGLGLAFADEAEAAPEEDPRAAVARLRRRLSRTEAMTLDFLPAPESVAPELRDRADIDERLIRANLRALLVTGGVLDLPEESRSHSEVRNLVHELGPELDHAVEGSLLRLQTLPRADRRRISALLRREPELVETVALELEGIAGRGGASGPRRLHLRQILRHVTWQLTHRPVDDVIAETVSQMRAQAAHLQGGEAAVREGEWAEASARIPEAFPLEDEDVPEWGERTRGQALRRAAGISGLIALGLGVAGAIMLGIGVSTGDFGLTIVALFVLTPAVVGLVVVLILLIASGIADTRLPEERPEPRPEIERPAEVEVDGPSVVLVARTISSGEGWVRTGISLAADGSYQLSAVALGESPPPTGDANIIAGDDAPYPGLPLGAVLARYGESTRIVGEMIFLVDAAGDLAIAVNEGPTAKPRVFRVKLETLFQD